MKVSTSLSVGKRFFDHQSLVPGRTLVQNMFAIKQPEYTVDIALLEKILLRSTKGKPYRKQLKNVKVRIVIQVTCVSFCEEAKAA